MLKGKRKTSDLHHPKNATADLLHHLKEKTYPTLLIQIDPKRCKPWRYHNRDAAWLTKEHCADLIQSIQRDGQLDPILVRVLSGDPDADYEIIYGVRRTFACTQISNQRVMARITDRDDKSCMILMHSENANSKDISEFERACSFAQQMKSGHFKNQTEMAKIMGCSQGSISKMIRAAEIFEVEWIAELFQTKMDIPIKTAYTLSLLLKKAETHQRVRKEAFSIQEIANKVGFLPSPKVLYRLISAAKGRTNRLFESVILTVDNLPIVSCKREKSGKFSIVIESKAKTLSALDIEAACIKALRKHVLHELFPGNNDNALNVSESVMIEEVLLHPE